MAETRRLYHISSRKRVPRVYLSEESQKEGICTYRGHTCEKAVSLSGNYCARKPERSRCHRTLTSVTSDRGADAQTCLNVISIRWDIEVFFEDTKELFGIDQHQIMTSDGLLRYWTLCWIAFSFLEELRHDLQHHKDCQSQISDQAEKVHLNAEKLDDRHLFLHYLSLGQAQRH